MGRQSKEPSKGWVRSMQLLIRAAAILEKNEAAQKVIDAQMKARTPIPEPKLSEEAQEVAKFSKVDQALMREAGEKFIALLKLGVKEGVQSVC